MQLTYNNTDIYGNTGVWIEEPYMIQLGKSEGINDTVYFHVFFHWHSSTNKYSFRYENSVINDINGNEPPTIIKNAKEKRDADLESIFKLIVHNLNFEIGNKIVNLVYTKNNNYNLIEYSTGNIIEQFNLNVQQSFGQTVYNYVLDCLSKKVKLSGV